MQPVFTIGHSTRTSEEQLSRDALRATLADARIQYMHEPDPGGRRAPRPDSPHVNGASSHNDKPPRASSRSRRPR